MTDDIRLRPLAVTDAGPMAAVLADPSLYTYTGGEPPSVEDLDRRYAVQTRGHSADGSQVWLNFLVLHGAERAPVGYVQATIPRDGSPTEISWVIGRPWQGHGYATAAGVLLLRELVGRGVRQVVAHIHPDNLASARVAAHLGMTATSTVVDGETQWVGEVPQPRPGARRP